MTAIDLTWHLANLFAVSLLFAAVAGTGARWLWPSLRRRSWARLTLMLWAAASVVTVCGLVAFGRDGRMATYALMALAAAAVLGVSLWRRGG